MLTTHRPTKAWRSALAATTTFVLAGLAAGAAQAQSYPIYAVKALPITGFTALGDQGLIIGRGFLPCSGSLCTQSESPVLYDSVSGAISGLTGGFGSSTQFGAINAKGQVAGTRIGYDATGAIVRSVVVRQPDGTFTTSPAPTLAATLGSPLQVRGFNANGQIALQYTDGLDAQSPLCGNYFGWQGSTAGNWQQLGVAGTIVSLSGLNAGGRAVGAAVPAATCGGVGGGFRAVASLPGGELVDLHGSMPGAFSRAYGINDLNYAVGEFDTGVRTAPDAYNPQGVPITHAAVWNTASQAWYDLSPAGTSSRLNGANARGEVVGRATGPVSATQPVLGAGTAAMLGNLATNWPMVNLNTLLSGNTAGWVLQEALAINASGQIVARGSSASGSGYVLLTPVQAPTDPYAVVPSAPASLMATLPSGQSVLLAWVNTARNATRLVVERCKGNTCRDFVAIATLQGDAGSYLDAGLARRVTYRYRVRAGNAAGLSQPGNVATITTLR